jgi:UDP-N-acetylglucosamine 2-epimerase (non-hydrolysing)
MKIDLVVGARPNFVKASAILCAAEDWKHEFTLVHTGQHDRNSIMSDPYFRDLGLPQPDPAHIMKVADGWNTTTRLGTFIDWLGSVYAQDRPDAVMVVGDTDSTLAGAIAAAKMSIPVLHVEAGLRTFDGIQEDTNRILVDSIAKKHYTTSDFADNNLAAEGKKGIQVGNVMVDTLQRFLPFAMRRFRRDDRYAVVTLHRAENVDDSFRCNAIISAINNIGTLLPVIWPIHPRMKKYECMIAKFIHTVPPMGYLEFIATLAGAEFVITDSGGVQEETTALGIPCFTVREHTERPETIWRGSNTLVPHPGLLYNAVQSTIRKFPPSPYKSGSAAQRIMEDLCATSF